MNSVTVVELPVPRGYRDASVIKAMIERVRRGFAAVHGRESWVTVLHVVGTSRFYSRVSKRVAHGVAKSIVFRRSRS